MAQLGRKGEFLAWGPSWTLSFIRTPFSHLGPAQAAFPGICKGEGSAAGKGEAAGGLPPPFATVLGAELAARAAKRTCFAMHADMRTRTSLPVHRSVWWEGDLPAEQPAAELVQAAAGYRAGLAVFPCPSAYGLGTSGPSCKLSK